MESRRSRFDPKLTVTIFGSTDRFTLKSDIERRQYSAPNSQELSFDDPRCEPASHASPNDRSSQVAIPPRRYGSWAIAFASLLRITPTSTKN